jgi:hypothetical protein
MKFLKMNKTKAVACLAGMRTTTYHSGVSTQFDIGPLKAHSTVLFSSTIFFLHVS